MNRPDLGPQHICNRAETPCYYMPWGEWRGHCLHTMPTGYLLRLEKRIARDYNPLLDEMTRRLKAGDKQLKPSVVPPRTRRKAVRREQQLPLDVEAAMELYKVG